uniref:F-box domain-containing protein n=1 Tax=Oryza meridionalis TaxID=40149 RepID=A0A0E0D0J0_9ORYZ
MEEPGPEEEKKEEEARFDFLEWIGQDTSAAVFTFLDHPADLARASAVSRSWRRFVLCIGGVVKIEFLGRVQKQEMDDLYYICISHVQIVGIPLPRELGVDPYKNGVVLKYYPDTRRSGVCHGESSGDDGRNSPSKWRNFTTRILHSSSARRLGWNQAILNRLFGAHDASEEEEEET